jgi:flagellin FlaB
LIHLFNGFYKNKKASIGIGALIIFIALILVAGITATVLIQTMNNFQSQAVKTGDETISDISSGIKIRQISGYANSSTIINLALYISTIAASQGIDLSETIISISDSSIKAILSYNSSCYSTSISNGLFNSINSSNLSADEFGIVVIRDNDNSCTAQNPYINRYDLIALIINTSKCFSGIGSNTEVFGSVTPENGLKATISFLTPSVYIDRIIDL